MADEDVPPPPPAPDYHETPYTMQHPDGSVGTYVLRTDRPVTHGEVSDYVASKGGVYMGPPQAPPSSTTTTTTTQPPTTTTQWQPPPLLPPNATDADRAARSWALGTGPPDAPASPAPAAPGPAPVPPPQPPSLMQAFGGYDLGSGAALSQALAPPALPEAPPGMERVKGAILPQRSLMSQAPSIIASTIGGRLATSAATPLGPELAIPIGIAGAGISGGIGEGGQILYEKATGAEPAEPGSAWQRMVNAAIRSSTFEGLTAPLRALPIAVATAAKPAAEAMQELEPVLTGKATGPLAQWWANWSQKPAADMAKEWFGKTAQEQSRLAGDHLPAMQNMMTTVAQSVAPVGKVGYGLYAASTAAPKLFLSGHPYEAAAALWPAAREITREAAPTIMSSIARGAEGSPWLLQLPRVAQVAGTLISPVVRGTAQTYGAQNWGDAETTLEPPRPQP